jgi:hypothetical protein
MSVIINNFQPNQAVPRRTRFTLLPEELNREIFKLAITSHFTNVVSNQMWLAAWLQWYKRFVDAQPEQFRAKFRYLLDYLFYEWDVPFDEHTNMPIIHNSHIKTLFPGDLEIEAVNTSEGLFVSVFIPKKDIFMTAYVLDHDEYREMFLFNDDIPDRWTITAASGEDFNLVYLMNIFQ